MVSGGILGPRYLVLHLRNVLNRVHTTTVPNVEDHQQCQCQCQCRFSVGDTAAQLTAYVCFVV